MQNTNGMKYDKETVKKAREYEKFIKHKDIVNLINAININNTDFQKIKNLLTECFDKQVQNLPIQNDTLIQCVFETFCLYVDNENSNLVFSPVWKVEGNSLDFDIVKDEDGLFPIDPIAIIAFNEWINEHKIQPNQTPPPETNVGKPFPKYLYHQRKEKLLETLHGLIDNGSNKTIAHVIIALDQLGFIAGYDSRSELFDAMREEFEGIRGYDTGFNFYIHEYEIEKEKYRFISAINKYVAILKNV